MGTVSLTLPADGDTIDAADVNTPLNALAAVINGGIDTNNISASAGITSAQLNFGGSGAGIWWQEIGRTTLGVAGDTISVTGLTAKKYLKILISATGTGAVDQKIRFNNDSTSTYAYSFSINGAADSSANTQSSIGITAGDSDKRYITTLEVVNVAASEKVFLGWTSLVSAGAGNVPTRLDFSGHWVNTSAAITRVDLINANTGDFAIGSELVVLGHD